MAVGDVVSGIGGDGAAIYFQPAAGVELKLVTLFCNGSADGGAAAITDGATTSIFNYAGDASRFVVGNFVIFINNTNYLTMNAPAAGRRDGYTGIQIK